MSTDWNKHFYQQVISKGNYDILDQTILEELFRMLVIEVMATDEDGEYDGDDDLTQAYYLVINEYLIPGHYSVVRKIIEDMEKQRELLQEESPTQA